ncbi:MAG: hypothetical protein OES79_12485, partial [Planctomycetota bacterium]|nr:hypothetical protein [Planctomycetota bacterium]
AQDPANQVGLYRAGTRVLEDITQLDEFRRPPWTSGYLQGIVDASFLNITPGTRLGVLHDVRFAQFTDALTPLEEALLQILKQQQQAEEERTSRQTLRSIQKALREALLTLPEEEYDWFDIGGRDGRDHKSQAGRGPVAQDSAEGNGGGADEQSAGATAGRMELSEAEQKQFFEHPGPLCSVRISPASCVVPIGQSKNFRAVPRDRRHLQVEENLRYAWRVAEGMGTLENADGEIATFHAPAEPMLTRIELQVWQDDITCTAEALITVTDSLVDAKKDSVEKKGLPSYTFQNAAGQLWRSRYEADKNVIVINKGHRDFVYCSRSKALKLRYICRLFAKELVYHNFPGYSGDQLLERMVELSLYAEEHLR